ncbi:MAG: hypothetical protein IJL78_00980 [Lachnospiraceae bacterium]|nr:hypothetical protein [Lachnospiraceae bacterium]
MEIRKKSALARVYAGPEHPIKNDAPEVLFMEAVCRKDTEAALGFFRDRKLFLDEPCAIDTPWGRFEGLSGIREFTEGFAARFGADTAELIPVIHTRANGRAVLEAEIHFVKDDVMDQVPMFIVADLRTPDTLDEIRIYCHYTFVPGASAYRPPIFKSAHLEMGDPNVLTGAVREYYIGLHHMPSVDVDRIVRCCGDKCRFGGYHPNDGDMPADRYEDIPATYKRMGEYIPRCVTMRYETLIDDGRTAVIEWVHIVSRAGQEERNRIAMSGIAAYERGDDGKLCAIRISDYAGCEGDIRWDEEAVTLQEARQVNFVEEMPWGYGRRGQE